MSFRIERLASGENAIVFRVSGRMHVECVNTLKGLIEEESAKIALDLSEVTHVDRDAAAFLAGCEHKGIELRNCSVFLRGSVSREQARFAP